MDLNLYARVLWRFRVVVAFGIVLGAALAFVSAVRLDLGGEGPLLTWREQERWAGYSTLLVTEPGFPLGRSVFEEIVPPSNSSPRPKSYLPPFGDPNRFAGLAGLYAQLVLTDPVRELALREGPIDPEAELEAAPVFASSGSNAATLPLVRIAAIEATGPKAIELARRITVAFQTYIADEQRAHGIPSGQRVQIELMAWPREARLLEGRSLTTSVVVFLAILLAAVGAAFVFENIRPKIRSVPVEAQDEKAAPAPPRKRAPAARKPARRSG